MHPEFFNVTFATSKTQCQMDPAQLVSEFILMFVLDIRKIWPERYLLIYFVQLIARTDLKTPVISF